MTTNVLDLEHDIATSDSRWSIQLPDAILFVDDTGFDKIFEHNGFLLVFAGTANLIQIWKNHISDPETSGIPPTDANGMSIAISITNLDNGSVVFEHRQAAVYENVRFAGSGASYAEQCWFSNFCARRAVESASAFDVCTGGSVKYYSFSGENNIDMTTTVKAIHESMMKEGLIMYKKQVCSPVPISEAAQQDPSLKKIMDDLATGKASMCAPFPNMHQPMSLQEKRSLEKAIAMVKKPR